MQHLVSEEGHPQADLAASKIQAVALHRLCHNEATISENVFGYHSDVWSRVQH